MRTAKLRQNDASARDAARTRRGPWQVDTESHRSVSLLAIPSSPLRWQFTTDSSGYSYNQNIDRPSNRQKCRACQAGSPSHGTTQCQDDENHVSASAPDDVVQRLADGESLDRTAPHQSSAELGYRIAHLRRGGLPLESGTRAYFEFRFGTGFSDVRIHTGAAEAKTARRLNARAFTLGQHIFFGNEEYRPQSDDGKRLIAHELTHTLQQRNTGSTSVKRIKVSSPEDEAEHEATRVADNVMLVDRPGTFPPQGEPEPGTPNPLVALQRNDGNAAASMLVQRQADMEDLDLELRGSSPAEIERNRRLGIILPSVSPEIWETVGGSPYSTVLPSYSQAGDTCGASSLITALVIWDRDNWDPDQPNSRIVAACNLILSEFERRQAVAIENWVTYPAPRENACCNRQGGCRRADEDHRTCLHRRYRERARLLRTEISSIRDTGRRPGAAISQVQYQTLGLALYFLWHQSYSAGLDSAQIHNIRCALGLDVTGAQSSSNFDSLEDILDNTVLNELQPGQIAQVSWLVNTRRGLTEHAFLIGRLQTGEWFLSDQGRDPAVEFRSLTLPDLMTVVRDAARNGSYWLHTGTSLPYTATAGVAGDWAGEVTLLGSNTATEVLAQNLIPAGAFLGEVDAHWLTDGNELYRGTFVGQYYRLDEAQAQFSAAAGGGTIVEMPRGVFTLYTTSSVHDANLPESAFDTWSREGALTGLRRADSLFHHIWLILGTASGRRGNWFQVR